MGRPSQCNPCCGVPCTNPSSEWDDDFSSDTVSLYTQYDQEDGGISATWSVTGGNMELAHASIGSSESTFLYIPFDISDGDIDDMIVRIGAAFPAHATTTAPYIFFADEEPPYSLADPSATGIGMAAGRAELFSQYFLGYVDIIPFVVGDPLFTGGSDVGSAAGDMEIKLLGRDHADVTGTPSSSEFQMQLLWDGTRYVSVNLAKTAYLNQSECAMIAGMAMNDNSTGSPIQWGDFFVKFS